MIASTAVLGFLFLCAGLGLWAYESRSVDLVEDLSQLQQATLYKIQSDGRAFCLPITSESNVASIERDLRSFKGQLPARPNSKGYLLSALDVNGKNKNLYLPPGESKYSGGQLETLKSVIRRADRGYLRYWQSLSRDEAAKLYKQYLPQ
jgi:hypothetical protein